MSDRSDEPSGFARVFAPLLGLLAVGGLVAAWRSRRSEAVVAQVDDEDSVEGHPS